MPCGLGWKCPSGPWTRLPCGSRKSAAATIAAGGASIPIRLVLTSSLPLPRFCASSINSWQRSRGDDRMRPDVLEIDLVADLDQHVGRVLLDNSQSTVLVTAAFTAASSVKVPLCLP